ncbi:MAG: ADOP family duplicated permease, partial [Acidobacteriota bacterium]
EPEHLVWISSYPKGPDGPRNHVAYSDVEALRAQRAFEQVAAYGRLPISIGTGRLAARVDGQIVSGDLFGMLGVRPVLGRGLPSSGSTAAENSGVVISEGLWRRLFTGQPSAIGSPVVLNGVVFTVAGVMPAGFTGPDPFEPVEAWVPIAARAEVLPRLTSALDSGTFWLNALARLAPGVQLGQARAVVSVVADSATREHPESHKDFGLRVSALRGLGPHERDEAIPISALLIGITVLVLLIACANVANLLLARGVKREPELRVRMALGGTRRRIIRQLMVESGLVAAAGSGAGLLLAMWGTDLLLEFAQVPVPLNTTPDFRVLAFTAATAVATTFLFGLTPALRGSAASVFPALREAGGHSARQTRLQRGLVTAQLVISLVLLSGTGMFLHSLAAARHVDVGFATAGRFSVDYDLQLQGYSDARARSFNQRLLEQVRATPAVRSATIAKLIPAAGTVYLAPIYQPGHNGPAHRALAAFNQVWPGFFQTMGIPLLAGRRFTEADAATNAPVAIISEQLASDYWKGASPLGRRLQLGVPGEPVREIIGVVKNVMIDEYNQEPWAVVYLPHAGAADSASLIVETAGGDNAIGGAARAVLRHFAALDANLPLGKVTTFSEHLSERLDKERALTRMLAVAGALALGLAALGLYGLMAHAVSTRRREVGVRVALGATRGEVLGMFIRQSARLVAVGIAVALPLAISISALIAGSLVGVHVGDPLPIAGAAAIMVLTMLAATWIPARRALAVDPSVVLKVE